MAAWKHFRTWDDTQYRNYRAFAAAQTPSYERSFEDCADISVKVLIDFAAANGLPVTFEDVDGYIYVSKGNYAVRSKRDVRADIPWVTKEIYTRTVQEFIQTKSLYHRNTEINPTGPEPGDLMMRFSEGAFGVHNHHTALVFARWSSGILHPKRFSNVPDFPGFDKATSQYTITQYFMGTVDDDWKTIYRTPDIWMHFDYLNSRGSAKRNAELIFFANFNQYSGEGYEFRQYAKSVLDNWQDWNGEGFPPRRLDGGSPRSPFEVVAGP